MARAVRVESQDSKQERETKPEGDPWKCPACEKWVDWQSHKGGYCPSCYDKRENARKAALRIEIKNLRRYAEATGDRLAAEFAQFLIEDEQGKTPSDPMSDPRCREWNRSHRSSRFRAWLNEQEEQETTPHEV